MNTDNLRLTRRTLVQAMGFGGAALVFGEREAGAQQGLNGKRLVRTSPDQLGVSPAAVVAFVEECERKVGGLHSFLLARHGQVAAEGYWAPYAPQYTHMLYSLSKSFTSTAVGLAVKEGKLTVDSLVTSFFPESLPAKVDPNLAKMKVKHLLSMGTGHDKDATGPMRMGDDWVGNFLKLPVEHEPGSKFVYNSAATYMCSAIVQKVTGMSVLDYLGPRLFGPLGIDGMTWENCPHGINTGGWGLAVKTEDIAKFGQLYLQKGRWNGKQLVPSAWVAEATSKQINNGSNPMSDWNQGYGYQFWRCRNNAYRGDGAFGQYCVVMPDQDAVLAITSGIGDMQAVLTAAWTHLLPGMSDGPVSVVDTESLSKRLGTLEVPMPAGTPSSPTVARVSDRTFRLAENPEKWKAVSFQFAGEKCTVTLFGEDSELKISANPTSWIKGSAPLLGAAGKTASRLTWSDANTLVIKSCFYETPYVETMTCKFEENQVTIGRKMNVSFGGAARTDLSGRAG